MILPSTEITHPVYDPRTQSYHYDVLVSDKEARIFGLDAMLRAVQSVEIARIEHYKRRAMTQSRRQRMAKWKGTSRA